MNVEPESSAIERGICSLCGKDTAFAPIRPGFSLRETRCPQCRSARRTRDLAACLLAAYAGPQASWLGQPVAREAMRRLRVYEAQAAGPLHEALKELPRYVCSEYIPDQAAPGGTSPGGIRCEDLERLSFPDESFDVVVTQDVLEHVADPWTAFREIRRVLRPGGRHFFTVPVHEGHVTSTRTALMDGTVVYLQPPVHHGDPLRSNGSLVFTDFGGDLPDRLASIGLPTRMIQCAAFYQPDELPWIATPDQYAQYKDAWERGEKASFLRYNSIVLISERPA